MLRVLVLFLVLFAAAAAYVFTERPAELADLLPGTAENHAPDPAGKAPEPATVDASDTETSNTITTSEDDNTPVSAPVVEAARQHIDQITAPPEQSIDIEQADHFVTIDQLLQIPAPQMQTEAMLETVETQVATPAPGQPQSFGVDTGVVTQAITDLPPPISAPINSPTTPIALTELSSDNKIKLQELLDTPDADATQVYYIHAVNDGDDQGLWGILQTGLTRTFAEGIKLKGQKDRLYAEIPEEADEKLSNNTSSFLGKLLQNKVSTTYIYNYRSGILGDNPDLIEPGQQLIIVQFSEAELVRVYNHFINQ